MFIRSATGWRKSRKELSANEWRLSVGFPGHSQDLIRRWAGLNRRIRTWKILSLFRDAISDGLGELLEDPYSDLHVPEHKIRLKKPRAI